MVYVEEVTTSVNYIPPFEQLSVFFWEDWLLNHNFVTPKY